RPTISTPRPAPTSLGCAASISSARDRAQPTRSRVASGCLTARARCARMAATPYPMQTPRLLASILLVLAAVSLRAQTAPASTTPTATNPRDEEAVKLSPFEVSSGDERGYA